MSLLGQKYRTIVFSTLLHSRYDVETPFNESFCFIHLHILLSFFPQKGAAPVTEGSDEEDDEDIDFDEDDFEGTRSPLVHLIIMYPLLIIIPLHCLNGR